MDLSPFLNNYNARPTNPQQVSQPKQSGIYGALAQAGLSAVGGSSQQAPTNQNVFQQPDKFTYDAATDPQYQAALNLAKGNIQTSQNNTLANLVAHGQGNSSYTAGVTQGIANKEMANVSNNILPQLIQQAYQHYQDGITNKFNVDSANYGVGRDNIGDNQWQKTFDAGRSDQADNLAINQGQLTGNYQSPAIAALLKEQGENSAAWANSSPADREKLHQRNMVIADALGQTYDKPTGTYSGGTSTRTVAGQQLDLNKAIDARDFDYKKQQDALSQAFAKEQYSDQKAQQIWDNTFKDKSFLQSVSDAAASRGLQWASLNQRDKEFIADQAFREKSFAADQEQRKIDNTYKNNEANSTKPITSEDYQSNLKPQYDKHGALTNGQQLEDQIILSGMSEWEQYKSYKANGIPWTDPVPQKPAS